MGFALCKAWSITVAGWTDCVHIVCVNASTATITARTITDEQIRALRHEAACAGDFEQVRICDRALRGRGGKSECAAAIQAARDAETSTH